MRRRPLLLVPPLLAALRSGPAAGEGARVLRIVAPVEIGGLELSRAGAVFARMGVVETLVAADADGRPVPSLAERWSSDAAGLAWRFALRRGLRFHDGTAVTPEAVAASLDRALADATALARVPVEMVQAAEDGVAFRLRRPFAALPAFLANYGSAILAPAAYDGAGRVQKVIGTGPFRVAALTLPLRLEVERFDQWWGGRPEVARAVYLAVGQGETRAMMAESGQADLVFGLQPATVARLRRNPKLEVRLVPIPRTRLLKLNLASPLFDDVRERQALSLAIDRQGIAAALLRNPALAATQLLPPASGEWHLPGLPPPARDLARARALLAEAGWRPGPDGILRDAAGRSFRAELRTYSTGPELPPIAVALQAQFRELGVAIEVVVGNASDIPRMHRDGILQLGLMSRNYGLVPDPLGALLTDFASGGGEWGAMNWSDAELPALLARMNGRETPEERLALRRRASGILREALPVIPVTWSELGVAIGPRVANVGIDPFETSYRVHAITWAAR